MCHLARIGADVLLDRNPAFVVVEMVAAVVGGTVVVQIAASSWTRFCSSYAVIIVRSTVPSV